jgi:hypothetical protein
LSKSKAIESPPLSGEEIRDVKKALKSKKWKTFNSVDDLLKDLHKSANVED